MRGIRSRTPRRRSRRRRRAFEVEIELDPQESVVAEAGSMMYMSDFMQMQTIFGDGSASSQSGGFFDKMLGAGKRLVTGESLFMTVFTHQGTGKAKAAFASPSTTT